MKTETTPHLSARAERAAAARELAAKRERYGVTADGAAHMLDSAETSAAFGLMDIQKDRTRRRGTSDPRPPEFATAAELTREAMRMLRTARDLIAPDYEPEE